MNNPENQFQIAVSVIVPVYNVEAYLEKCLNSIIEQSLQNIEIIAVNDGSTDGSDEILNRLSAKTEKLKVINQENQGLSAARNAGINAANGQFVAFVDGDDFISSTMLEKMYGKAVRKNLDIVWCRYQQIDQDGSVVYVSGRVPDQSKKEIFKQILAAKLSTMACNKLFRKELFTQNDVEFPKGRYHEDVGTIYKLFYYADTCAGIYDVCYFWLRRKPSHLTGLRQSPRF